MTKGILLAGGNNTRLYPITRSVNKQLLPIYDKPMIYYPLSMMMLAGIRDILIISTPNAIDQMRRLLRDGSQWGLNFDYCIQLKPRGLADAFILGEEFIGEDGVCLMLGDNICYGQGLSKMLQSATYLNKEGATIFAYYVTNPERYGVVEFDKENKVISIEEKPPYPRSNYAVPGIYFYDNHVVELAKNLKPSARGELEITDINLAYITEGKLSVNIMGRGIAWLDAGTCQSLMQASNFVQAIEERQGIIIASPEETAYRMRYIDLDKFRLLSEEINSGSYGEYLRKLYKDEKNALQMQ